MNADLSVLLAPLPSINYAQNMQNARKAFHTKIQSPMDASTRHELIDTMQSSLIACFKFMPLNQAVEEAQKTLDFIQQFTPEHLLTYPWLAELDCAYPLTVVITCELSMFFNHAAWPYFHILFRDNKPQCNDVLQNLLVSTLYFASAHLDLAFTYLELLDSDNTRSLLGPRLSEDDIKFSTQQAENYVNDFNQQVLYCKFREQRIFFELDHVLFLAFTTQAKLALRQNKFDEVAQLINHLGVFIQRYRHTAYFKTHRHAPNTIVLFRELKHALKIKKNHAQRAAEKICDAPSSPPPLPSSEVCTQNEPEITDNEQPTIKAPPEDESQHLIGRKRLKKRKKETYETGRLPTCYEKNPRLRSLLDQYSDIFIACDIDAYLFGSGNYKQDPSDFDILIPNISTDYGKKRLMQLVQIIEARGGVALRDKKTGDLGYKKPNRHVIPLTWHDWKTDLIIASDDFIEHAKRLDVTVGALYFSFRNKKMFGIKELSSLSDLDHKIIRTISDPHSSFIDDPSIIFRNIRLCALENFTFSTDCLNALNTLFFKEKNNVFLSLNYGKLCQQLNLIFKTPEETKILDQFQKLGLLAKLSQSIHALPQKFGSHYVISLMQYKSSSKHHVCNASSEKISASKLSFYSTPSAEAIKQPSSKIVTAPVSTL